MCVLGQACAFSYYLTIVLLRFCTECWEYDNARSECGNNNNGACTSSCSDHNRYTRNDQCSGGTCAGTAYTCSWCERHDGSGCQLLSQISAAKECDTSLHSSECSTLGRNLMGCPKLSHRKPTATHYRSMTTAGVWALRRILGRGARYSCAEAEDGAEDGGNVRGSDVSVLPHLVCTIRRASRVPLGPQRRQGTSRHAGHTRSVQAVPTQNGGEGCVGHTHPQHAEAGEGRFCLPVCHYGQTSAFGPTE